MCLILDNITQALVVLCNILIILSCVDLITVIELDGIFGEKPPSE